VRTFEEGKMAVAEKVKSIMLAYLSEKGYLKDYNARR